MFAASIGLLFHLAVAGQSGLPSPAEIAKLPPDGGPEFNRLVFEKSPYLLQHARNPVDWYPWGDAAFARARKEEKPVFLSVGYSTCHWCHVMERESFEDAEVAALLNAGFVCIKVDREERPDVDQVYMTVAQAMTGSGGWPMTIVMTPDQKPFFAGTYFQKPALIDVLRQLADAWKTKRKDVAEHADKVAAWAVSAQIAAPGGAPAPALLETGAGELASRFDSAEGGFDIAPKFPVPHQLGFLLRRWKASGDAHALLMVECTLAAMARGGIHDQLGGGFHRYSTDRRWRVPHFEKMLYDQALIGEAYVEAFEATRKPVDADLARDVFGYVLRDLAAPEGAFFSSEDADSEGEEGKFYVWSRAEVLDALGADDGALFADVYGVSAIERSVLHVADPARAAEPGMRAARAKLLAVRGQRVRPLRDEKVLTDWNGLMIGALAHGSRALGEPAYADAARRAAEFVIAKVRDEKGRLLKRWARGEAAHAAVIDDYAFLCQGLIELYETDFDPRWLAEALRLATAMTSRFWDEKNGGFFFTASDGEALIARGKESYDGAIPSGNAVAALDLLRLGHLTGDTALLERADKLFRAFADGIAKGPSNHAQMLIALEFATGPASEIVIAGADSGAMLSAVRARFLPNAVVLLRPDGDDPAIAKVAPFVRATTSIGGKATAYVCSGFACQAPVTDVAALEKLLPR